MFWTTTHIVQNKLLENIVYAPCYVGNSDLHRDLKMEVVDKFIQKHAEPHEQRFRRHVNTQATRLLENNDLLRRLIRTKSFELV